MPVRNRSKLSLVLLFLLAGACASAPPGPPPAPVASVPLSAPVRGPRDETPQASVARAAKVYLDLVVRQSPEKATELGFHQRDDELDDRSVAALRANDLELEAMLRELESIPNPPLSGPAAIDLDLLKRAIRVDLQASRERRPEERSPNFYISALYSVQAITGHDYAPLSERGKHAIARIEKLPQTLALAKQQLKNPPRVYTEIGIQSAKGARTFLEDQRVLLREALPSEAERIDRAVKTASSAFSEFSLFLEKELLPRSQGDYRAGRAYFEFLLREKHALKESSAELQTLGETVFARTQDQLKEVAKRIDPHAQGWEPVLARVKGRHPKSVDLLPTYAREVARARKFLEDKGVVSFPRGERCDVVATPAFQRSTITAAYDQPAPFDPVTQGLFYVTPIDSKAPPKEQEEALREHDFGDIVDTTVHETYPGHHLQLSFARIHPSLTRKMFDTSLFSEGWALYAEELMNELGYYTDEERLMQLEWVLVRSARVLIDIGLHTGTLKFDDAVSLLVDKVHLERPMALSEVRRYTMNPTQPLSYLVGREMIFRLRDRYKAREGATFTLRRFHDDLLSHGTIPLGLVEREMFDEVPSPGSLRNP